jgi:hypothetical protein
VLSLWWFLLAGLDDSLLGVEQRGRAAGVDDL